MHIEFGQIVYNKKNIRELWNNDINHSKKLLIKRVLSYILSIINSSIGYSLLYLNYETQRKAWLVRLKKGKRNTKMLSNRGHRGFKGNIKPLSCVTYYLFISLSIFGIIGLWLAIISKPTLACLKLNALFFMATETCIKNHGKII